jgi:hypothetical protein
MLGERIGITDENADDLSMLATEFEFRALSSEIAAFRVSPG